MENSRFTRLLETDTLLVDRYQLLRKISQGGSSSVYLAKDHSTSDKLVAIKEVSYADTKNSVEREEITLQFVRESQALAHLKHPNIVDIYDWFNHEEKNYIVMEYVEGSTLEELLARRGHAFTETEVLPWFQQLCGVLKYLHQQNPPIIFRDVKPANIVINSSGKLKLIDFGIARSFIRGKTKDTRRLGTAGYAPPEQYGKSQTDIRSDIYSLGVTLYQLLTNYQPSNNPWNLPPIDTLNSNISIEMRQVISRAVELDPQNRWQSIEEIQNFLKFNYQRPSIFAAILREIRRFQLHPLINRLFLEKFNLSPSQPTPKKQTNKLSAEGSQISVVKLSSFQAKLEDQRILLLKQLRELNTQRSELLTHFTQIQPNTRENINSYIFYLEAEIHQLEQHLIHYSKQIQAVNQLILLGNNRNSVGDLGIEHLLSKERQRELDGAWNDSIKRLIEILGPEAISEIDSNFEMWPKSDQTVKTKTRRRRSTIRRPTINYSVRSSPQRIYNTRKLTQRLDEVNGSALINYTRKLTQRLDDIQNGKSNSQSPYLKYATRSLDNGANHSYGAATRLLDSAETPLLQDTDLPYFSPITRRLDYNTQKLELAAPSYTSTGSTTSTISNGVDSVKNGAERVENKTEDYTKLKRFTDVRFPGQCMIGYPTILTVQLTLHAVKLDDVSTGELKSASPISLSLAPTIEEKRKQHVKLIVLVSTAGFIVDRRWCTLTMPFNTESEKIGFELVGQELGEQIIEVEFYHQSRRIGYVVVKTEIIDRDDNN